MRVRKWRTSIQRQIFPSRVGMSTKGGRRWRTASRSTLAQMSMRSRLASVRGMCCREATMREVLLLTWVVVAVAGENTSSRDARNVGARENRIFGEDRRRPRATKEGKRTNGSGWREGKTPRSSRRAYIRARDRQTHFDSGKQSTTSCHRGPAFRGRRSESPSQCVNRTCFPPLRRPNRRVLCIFRRRHGPAQPPRTEAAYHSEDEKQALSRRNAAMSRAGSGKEDVTAFCFLPVARAVDPDPR